MLTSDYLEGRLIGAALHYPETLSLLSPSDFNLEQSQVLWRAMRDCRNRHNHIDVHVFRDFVMQEMGLDLSESLASYMDMAPANPSLAENYIKILADMNRKTRLDEGLARLVDIDAPVDEKIAAMRDVLESAAPRVTHIPKTMREHTRDVIGHLDELFNRDGLPGVETGFRMFDQVSGGLQKQDLYVLAARPSIGKTALAVNIALQAERVAFFSTEQPAIQIVQRMLAIHGGIPSHKLRNPRKLEEDEWQLLTTAAKFVSELDIQILDDPAPTIESVSTMATEAVARGAELLIVDYLQRLRTFDKRMSTYDRISHVAMSLKEMARRLNVPILALAQINRAGAGNARIEHLKGSGDIEQEADLIAILDRNIEANPSLGVLSIEKNRHGPLVDVPLHFDGMTLRFTENHQ